jgi:hypothetical protein
MKIQVTPFPEPEHVFLFPDYVTPLLKKQTAIKGKKIEENEISK